MKDVETILRALNAFDGYEAMLYDSNKGEIVRFQDVVDFVVWQNSEIERLKQDINGYVADQEVWINGYRGTQKENEGLKEKIERLTEDNKRLNELLVGGTEVIDYWNNKYLEEQAKNAELQKQVDEAYQKGFSDGCAYETKIEEMAKINENLQKQLEDMEEQRDNQAYIAEDLIQEKHRWTEQAIKDTAQKIQNEAAEEASAIFKCELVISLNKLEEICNKITEGK